MSMGARITRANSRRSQLVQSNVDLHAEAEQSARMSIELYEGLSREFPSIADLRYRRAFVRLGLIRSQLKAGRGSRIARGDP